MLQAPAGHPPDVSVRLRRACDLAAAADTRGGSRDAEASTGELDRHCSKDLPHKRHMMPTVAQTPVIHANSCSSTAVVRERLSHWEQLFGRPTLSIMLLT